jgi:hypothetical protein
MARASSISGRAVKISPVGSDLQLLPLVTGYQGSIEVMMVTVNI